MWIAVQFLPASLLKQGSCLFPAEKREDGGNGRHVGVNCRKKEGCAGLFWEEETQKTLGDGTGPGPLYSTRFSKYKSYSSLPRKHEWKEDDSRDTAGSGQV